MRLGSPIRVPNSCLDWRPARGTKTPLARLRRCEKLVVLLNDTRRRRGADDPHRRAGIGWSGWRQALVPRERNELVGAYRLDQRGRGAARRRRGRAAREHLKHAENVQKDNAEFVSAVSHEMKTPLAGIKAYVELLADGDAEDEAHPRGVPGVINGQADRLQRLIDNLLNLARIEAGVVKVSKQPHRSTRSAGRGVPRRAAVGRGQENPTGRTI